MDLIGYDEVTELLLKDVEAIRPRESGDDGSALIPPELLRWDSSNMLGEAAMTLEDALAIVDASGGIEGADLSLFPPDIAEQLYAMQAPTADDAVVLEDAGDVNNMW